MTNFAKNPVNFRYLGVSRHRRPIFPSEISPTTPGTRGGGGLGGYLDAGACVRTSTADTVPGVSTPPNGAAPAPGTMDYSVFTTLNGREASPCPRSPPRKKGGGMGKADGSLSPPPAGTYLFGPDPTQFNPTLSSYTLLSTLNP